TTGTTVVNASTTVTVNGVSLTRTTNGTAGNSGPANKNWADDTVTTPGLDASNNHVTNTTVRARTGVHHEATVTPAAGTPAAVPDPTGTVTCPLSNNGTCNGTTVGTSSGTLNASGVAVSADFTTPAGGGTFSYLAHYNGDANYPAKDGPCEPFTVQTFAPQL